VASTTAPQARSPAGVRVIPVRDVEDLTVVEVFNAGFRDYYHPVSIDLAGYREYLVTNDISTDASFVAFVGDRPAGFTLTGVRGTRGWVGGLAVDSGFRRMGVGARLLTSQIEALRERGVEEVRLEVIDRNLSARTLYERYGFRDNRKIWYFQNDHPRIKVLPSVLEITPCGVADVLSHYKQGHTWPKEVDSLRRTTDHSAVLARKDGEVVGYGVYLSAPEVLYIYDIGSRKYGEHILNHIIDKVRPPRITIANVFDRRLANVLADNGFMISLALFEMKYPLVKRGFWPF